MTEGDDAAGEPRLWFLSLAPAGEPSREIPLDWWLARGRGRPPLEFAVELGRPGMRVTVMGTGDFSLPGGAAGYGTVIAAWLRE